VTLCLRATSVKYLLSSSIRSLFIAVDRMLVTSGTDAVNSA